MPSSTNQESLAASQRLLDYIAGGRKPAESPEANAASGASASAAESQAPAAADEKSSRGARLLAPVKKLSKAFSSGSASVIGITCDAEGVFLTRTHHLMLGEPYLENVVYAPYPAGTDVEDLPQRVACAVAALKNFAPDYARCRLWATLDTAEVSLLSLPALKAEERDAVALLKASQQTKIDAADLVFDYRLLANAPKGGEAKALGLAGSKSALDKLVAEFERLDVKLAGVTSSKLSPVILHRPAFGASHWKDYAALTVGDEVSVLSLFSEGRMVQQRSINFGRQLFLSKVMEKLAFRDNNRGLTTDSGRARLLHAASAMMANPMPTEEERQLLAESLDESVRRMVSYVARTVNYYQRVEKGRPLEGLYVTASHGIEQVIHTELEQVLGIPSEAYQFTAARSPAADAGIQNISGLFKDAALIDAIAIGFADDNRIPNLLETPDVRRVNKRFALIRKAAAVVIGVISAVLIAAGLYFAWGWYDAHTNAAAKERQLSAVTKPLTPAMLKEETAKLARLEADGADLLKKRRFAALMAEIAAIKGDDIFITGMTLTDASTAVAADNARRGRSNRSQSLADATGRRVMTISAELFQSPQERETALAHFLNRLEASMKDAAITVRRDEAKGAGYPVVIRMEGSF